MNDEISEMSVISVAKAMVRYGGGFAMRLGDALLHADLDNQRRIKKAFPEIWKQYNEMACKDMWKQALREKAEDDNREAYEDKKEALNEFEQENM